VPSCYELVVHAAMPRALVPGNAINPDRRTFAYETHVAVAVGMVRLKA
jgi:hypothetical protein